MLLDLSVEKNGYTFSKQLFLFLLYSLLSDFSLSEILQIHKLATYLQQTKNIDNASSLYQ